jgi:hypothetical protein
MAGAGVDPVGLESVRDDGARIIDCCNAKSSVASSIVICRLRSRERRYT